VSDVRAIALTRREWQLMLRIVREFAERADSREAADLLAMLEAALGARELGALR
jgi:hypothetical protein